MKTIFFFCAILASLCMSAQQHQLGIQLGTSSTNVASDGLLYGTYSINRNEGFVGLNYGFRGKGGWSFGTGIHYQQRGFEQKMVSSMGVFSPENAPKRKLDYDYVAVPVKLGLYFGKKVYGFVSAGVVPAMLLRTRFIITDAVDTNGTLYRGLNVEMKGVDSFDLAGLAEAGGGYTFNNRFSLNASVAFQHSLTSISNKDHFHTKNVRHVGWFTSVGAIFSFTRE